MIRTLARYKVRPEHVREAVEIVRKFADAVRAAEPDTECEAYQGSDGVTFIHIMDFPDEDAEHRHQQARYTVRFIEAVSPCCEIRPSFLELTSIA